MKRYVKLLWLSFVLSSVFSCAGIEDSSQSELGLSPVEIEVSISSEREVCILSCFRSSSFPERRSGICIKSGIYMELYSCIQWLFLRIYV